MTSSISNILELYSAMNYDESQAVFPSVKNWLLGKDPLKCFQFGKLESTLESDKCELHVVRDPCTDNYIVSLVISTEEDVKTVLLNSSSNGQKVWSNLDEHARGKHISRVAKILEEQKNVLAEVEAVTFGGTLSEINREVTLSHSYFQYYATWAHINKNKKENPQKGAVVIILTKPTPLFIIASTVASALAAGCAVLINPPVESPLTSFLLAELCTKAGLPAGVVNVIPGPINLAKELLEEHVQKLVVYGSKSSCRSVCTDLTNLSLPLAPFYFGKSLSIIFDSSDQTSAIEVLLKNISFSYLQMPWSVRTILIEESSFITFVDALKKKLSSCKVGHFCDNGIDIGLPKKCDANTTTYLNDMLKHFQQRGIEVFQIPVVDSLFFPPTFIIGTDAETNSVVKDNDILPFVSIIPFRRSDEAIEIANKSQFGVAASVWTTCLSLSLYMASKLEVSTVWINDHGVIDPSVTFTNRKLGFGYVGGQKGLQQFLPFPLRDNLSQPEGEIKEKVEAQVQKKYSAHYGGSFKQTNSESCISVLSSTGDHFFVHECDRSDIKKAIDSARLAQHQWWKIGITTRIERLLNVAEKFQEAAKSFLKLFRHTAPEKNRELENAVNYLYVYASRNNYLTSSKDSNPLPNTIVQNLQDPFGVIGILMDDSSELEDFILAVASAISFGNSVVVMPNSKNPVPALEFSSFLTHLKIPPGLVNVIPSSTHTLFSEVVFHNNVNAIWYCGNNKTLLHSLHNMSNKVMKLLWKCPDKSINWCAAEFEYAATHTKAVWIPSENVSC